MLTAWTVLPSAFSFSFYTSTQHRRETIGSDGVVSGEYGYLTPDGVYRTTVYTTTQGGAFVVLAQTTEKRGASTEGVMRLPERKKEFAFDYTTQDSRATNQRHHHEVRLLHSVTNYISLLCSGYRLQ